MSEILFEENSDALLIVDASRNIMRVNGACRALIGDAAEIQGQPIWRLFHDDDHDSVSLALSEASFQRDMHLSRKARLAGVDNAGGRMVALTVLGILKKNSSFGAWVIRLNDLSLQIKMETERAQAQKMQAVGALAGGIAHDFNNLLTIIIGASDEILAHEGADRSILEEATHIRGSAQRGADLVHQLLAFGRQQVLRPRLVSVNAAITGVAGLLGRLLGETIRLECVLEEPGRLVRIDPTQLDRVLINLAVNARNAMPQGGTLTLKTRSETLYRPLSAGSETIPPGRYALVDIVDTGTGISPDILPRIFDPFFTTRGDQGGSGLGLATVHGIVRQSGGFLQVISVVGEGACFRLYLPRVEGAAAVAEAVAPARGGSVKPLRAGRLVLIVEDEDGLRRLVERSLTRAGWRVLAAETAEAALAMLPHPGVDADSRLSAVISDVVMPGMNGPKLVAAVRETYPDLPAILVSGYAEAPLRRELLESGIAFLPKPYTPQSLLEALRDAVPSDGRAPEGPGTILGPLDMA